MAAMGAVVLLALAAVCQGASLREKRDVVAGDFDRTFDMFGVHVGLKYIDPSNKLMGGKLAVKIDDLKAMIPRAHSSKVEVEVNFDGHELPLFKAFVNYAMVHADGDGEEKGSFTVERKQVGDMWVTNIKTSTAGSALTGGAPIIPAIISNAEIELESDWMTKLNAKYINPTRNRNIVLHVVRVPGESINLELVSGDKKFELNLSVKDFDLRKADGNFEFKATGSTPAGPFEGFVQGVNDNGNYKVKIEFSKGGKKLLQVSTQNKIELASQKFSTKLKWSLMGGASQGEMKLKFENSELKTKVKFGDVDLDFRAKIIPGELADIEGKKNGVTMWTYKSKRTTVSDGDKFQLDMETDMTLSSDSMFHAFLDKYYPYGAFNVRHNKLSVFVDKKNRNLIFPAFKVVVELDKEGKRVVDILADTTAKPYKFFMEAPNVFQRWGYPEKTIDITIVHIIGDSLVIDANFAGGLHLEAKRGPNAKGGRDIKMLTKRAGKQMMKLDISTSKVWNNDEIKLGLTDSLEIDPESILYKNVISKYRFLTTFQKRQGSLEIYVNKKDKNLLLNKFFVKGEVVKDGDTAAKILLTTNEKPYKLEIFLPVILQHIKPGMTEAKISIDHQAGEKLEVVTNFEKFKGFKIAKTGNGNERVIEINGRQLAKGDYTLTDQSFSTKVTLEDGNFLEPKITWVGALPNNRAEAVEFFLKNHFKIKVTGSRRNLNLDLNWKMTKPDFDFSTPENGKLSLKAEGNNPNWGNYKLARDVNFKIESKVIEAKIVGESQFESGILATATPIQTDVAFKFLMNDRDLIGHFKKVINGKEYSVDFPEGFGTLPKIKMGQ
jgi:hypothetical protein